MGEMIAQNASNKDSRSLNEPRDVGRRKRIGHSPPTNIPGHVPRSPPRDVAACISGKHSGESGVGFRRVFGKKTSKNSPRLMLSTIGCCIRAAKKEAPRERGLKSGGTSNVRTA